MITGTTITKTTYFLRTLAVLLVMAAAVLTVGFAKDAQAKKKKKKKKKKPVSLPAPNGATIAFTSFRDANNMEVYKMDALDGANQTRLTNNPARDYDPDWSPDGTTIAFTTSRDGNAEIYIMDKDGNYPFNYTRNSAEDFGATWAPGGEHLAFTRVLPGRNGSSDYEVHEMGLAGTFQTNLSRSESMEDHPSYTPDAKQIAFTTNRDGNEEIYVMNGLASSPKNLTNNATDDFDPDWAKASS